MQQCNKFYLTRYSPIQRFLAGFFLFVFALGITPRLPLHNLVANHKDGRSKKSLRDAHTTQLTAASYNCPTDNLVSESAFIPAEDAVIAVPVSVTDIHQLLSLSAALARADIGVFFRGPPVV